MDPVGFKGLGPRVAVVRVPRGSCDLGIRLEGFFKGSFKGSIRGSLRGSLGFLEDHGA